MRPLISGSWESQTVFFPDFKRTLASGYRSVRSETLRAYLRNVLPSDSLRLGSEVELLQRDRVVLSDGSEVFGSLVIDARGWESQKGEDPAFGYQKFLGLDVLLESPHGLTAPIIMDARVAQVDGYRFMYTLPWDSHRLLIEDTHYSSNSNLLESEYEGEILRYAERQGWKVSRIERREKGILPIPCVRTEPRLDSVTIGVRAGNFHPTTGYSLPWSVRWVDGFTEALKKQVTAGSRQHPLMNDEEALRFSRAFQKRKLQFSSFYYFLNRMFFWGVSEQASKTIQLHDIHGPHRRREAS